MIRPIQLAFALLLVVSPAKAHEFWIAADKGAVKVGESISASLLVGRWMEGVELPYLSSTATEHAVTVGRARTDLASHEGDIPAISFAPKKEGLHIFTHQTAPLTVRFDEWAMFVNYLEDEGLPEIADIHGARGLPDHGFEERYRRCAKALVQVGDAESSDIDHPTNMPFELVLESNPYAGNEDTLVVRLLRFGNPVANRQIAVFVKNETVSRSLVVTDENGRATISVSESGSYLLNAVDLQPIEQDGENSNVVWESYWASLTFVL